MEVFIYRKKKIYIFNENEMKYLELSITVWWIFNGIPMCIPRYIYRIFSKFTLNGFKWICVIFDVIKINEMHILPYCWTKNLFDLEKIQPWIIKWMFVYLCAECALCTILNGNVMQGTGK